MIFLAICFSLIGMRVAFSRILPIRLLSASTISLAGILVFIGLGLEFDRFYDPWLGVLIIIVFYFFFLLGELIGKKIKFYSRPFHAFGEWVLRKNIWRFALLLIFAIYIVLPFLQVLFSGSSPLELLRNTWTTSGIAERSQALLTNFYEQADSANLLKSILAQFTGAWYLSIGVAIVFFPKLSFIGLAFNIFVQLIVSTGNRSGVMIAIGMVVTLWILVKRHRTFIVILILLIIFIGAVATMDILMKGRGGMTTEGSLVDRIEQTLKNDFAYGGLGLNFAAKSRPPSVATGLDYLKRFLLIAVPRVLWPGKQVLDPNWEMTENYRSASMDMVGSISLFTPLGEAVFYFGYWGLIIVPLLYGFTVSWLERLYSTSLAFSGLRAQVYVWAFLGMRHTFFNLFLALVISNFMILIILLIASWVWWLRLRKATP